ncbi:MAG: hypothetical protein ABIK65_11390 [Candidatus Eisenbacteria bacterium]
MRYKIGTPVIVGCIVVCLISLGMVVGGCGDTSCNCPESGQPPVIFPPASVWDDGSGVAVSFEVDPRGLPTLCDCLYDTTLVLAHASGSVSAGDGYGCVGVTLALPDAEFDREYLFQCRAYSRAGTTYTAINAFTLASPNIPPETALSFNPAESDTNGNYAFRMYWFGWDPDGSIDHYDIQTEVDFVQSGWFSVVVAESVFVLGPEIAVYWMFSVRAVDNMGIADPTPETVVLIPDEWEVFQESPKRPSKDDREQSVWRVGPTGSVVTWPLSCQANMWKTSPGDLLVQPTRSR